MPDLKSQLSPNDIFHLDHNDPQQPPGPPPPFMIPDGFEVLPRTDSQHGWYQNHPGAWTVDLVRSTAVAELKKHTETAAEQRSSDVPVLEK